MLSQTKKIMRNRIRIKFDKEYAWIQNYKKREYEKKYFKINLLLLRFWHNGNINKKLRCKISNKVLEFKANYLNIKTNRYAFQLHHPAFINGKSKNKEISPSKIMKYNLLKVQNLEKLNELISCFVLDSDVHSWIHESRRNSDIKDYPKDKWPWALQNKENYYLFFDTYKIKPKYSYNNFIKNLNL